MATPIAAIGIVQDQKFAPDERMRAIFDDAVATAKTLIRAVTLRPRESERFLFYPGTGSQ